MRKFHYFKNKILLSTVALTLSFSLFFSGCVRSNKVSENNTTKQTNSEEATTQNTASNNTFNEEFEKFTDELFKDEIAYSALTLHYTIANPEDYGITEYGYELGDYSEESFNETIEDCEGYLEKLTSFDYDSLSNSQQITYDLFKQYLETELEYSDLYLYTETLSPTIGEQAQLPIVMAEYKFYREADVQDYLKIMRTIPDYFKSIIDFQKRKVKAGLFMCDFAVDDITDQCKEFIANPNTNLLLTTFDNRIDELNIDDSMKKKYKDENLKIVKTGVIPAYQYLIDELTKLKGNGTNDSGLCNYENGKEYYEYLIKSEVGSYRSVDEIHKLITDEYDKDIASYGLIYAMNTGILDELDDYSDLNPDDTPENILKYLRTSMNDAFPNGGSDKFLVKYVDKSLENFVSPAMYLTPAIDKLSENIIYINNANQYEGAELVVTLAHEGYPGHLYQTTYFSETNPSLIRSLLNFKGYTEGWATYVEMYSYGYGGREKDVVNFSRLNKELSLNMYSQIDMGINYYGWTKEDTRSFLAKNYGDEAADEYLEDIYHSMIEEPGNYLTYYLGYLELSKLQEKAKSELGDKFSLKEFNTFILDFGPAQFNVIEKYLDKWINEQK